MRIGVQRYVVPRTLADEKTPATARTVRGLADRAFEGVDMPQRKTTAVTAIDERPRMPRLLAVAEGGVQAAYRDYIDHAHGCAACHADDCRVGADLLHIWREARGVAQ